MKDYYKILGIKQNATPNEIHSAYKRLCLTLHPDRGGSADKFADAVEAHETLSDPTKRQRYDSLGLSNPIILRSKNFIYTVGKPVCSGDLADLRAGEDQHGKSVLLKAPRDPKDSDLLQREAETLTKLRASDSKSNYIRYLPSFIESFEVRDSSRNRRTVNVIEPFNDQWHTLSSVRSLCPKLRFEHGVWMLNRILECIGFSHKNEIVHGALVPDNIMVYSSSDSDSPWDHGVVLLDWCYSVNCGEPVRAIVPKWNSFYPPEIFEKRKAGPETDIYMAAKCIMFVLGGDVKSMSDAGVPAYLINFLRGCTLGNPAARPSNAWKLHEEFKCFMAEHYGRKKYVRFALPKTN